MGAVARGHAPPHAPLYDDGRAAGDRTRHRRRGSGRILSQRHGIGTGDHGRIAEFRYRSGIRHDSRHRPSRGGADASRTQERELFRPLAELNVTATNIATVAGTTSHARSSDVLWRVLTGLVILLIW